MLGSMPVTSGGGDWVFGRGEGEGQIGMKALAYMHCGGSGKGGSSSVVVVLQG